MTPWYEQPEAKALLLKAALGGVTYERHVKHYAISKDEWLTAEGPIAARLRELSMAPFAQYYPREEVIAMGGCVDVEQAIEMTRSALVQDQAA